MENVDMRELVLKFNMVKPNKELFTDDEIDEFNDEFISLVEKHGYLVGGSIGPYNENDECYENSWDDELDNLDGLEDMDIEMLNKK